MILFTIAVVYYCLNFRDDRTYFIGASDAETEHVYRWVNGKPMSWTNWEINQPRFGTRENAMIIRLNEDAKWNDYDSNWSANYICQSTQGKPLIIFA